jgi:hypothetical protein
MGGGRVRIQLRAAREFSAKFDLSALSLHGKAFDLNVSYLTEISGLSV